MLVGLGSALFTIVSAYGWTDFRSSPGPGIVFDPTRIAAQIVTGIGFLGAGAIIRQGLSIRGLTTAAGLWVVGGDRHGRRGRVLRCGADRDGRRPRRPRPPALAEGWVVRSRQREGRHARDRPPPRPAARARPRRAGGTTCACRRIQLEEEESGRELASRCACPRACAAATSSRSSPGWTKSPPSVGTNSPRASGRLPATAGPSPACPTGLTPLAARCCAQPPRRTPLYCLGGAPASLASVAPDDAGKSHLRVIEPAQAPRAPGPAPRLADRAASRSALPEETGATFYENARLRPSRARREPEGRWTLGEDSGLEVGGLGGRPRDPLGALRRERCQRRGQLRKLLDDAGCVRGRRPSRALRERARLMTPAGPGVRARGTSRRQDRGTSRVVRRASVTTRSSSRRERRVRSQSSATLGSASTATGAAAAALFSPR